MKIPCPHCNGAAKVEFAGALLETYNVMRSLGPATRSEIHRATPALEKKNGRVGNGVAATYQRVKRLADLGLVKEKEGKWAAKAG